MKRPFLCPSPPQLPQNKRSTPQINTRLPQETPNYLKETPDYLKETPNYLKDTPNALKETPNYPKEIANYLRALSCRTAVGQHCHVCEKSISHVWDNSLTRVRKTFHKCGTIVFRR